MAISSIPSFRLFIVSAIASPASLPLMSNATPILETSFVKSAIFELSSPSCPPEAEICASSFAFTPSSRLSCFICSPKFFTSSSLLKSTYFLTSAIELSKSTASLTGTTKLAAVARLLCHLPSSPLILPTFVSMFALSVPILAIFSFSPVTFLPTFSSPALSLLSELILPDKAPKPAVFRLINIPTCVLSILFSFS